MTAPKRGYRANRRQFGGLRHLPSKRWQASYTGPDGARHKAHSTYLRKGDAEAWLRDEELLIDRHEWTPPATRDPKTATLPTLGDVLGHRLALRCLGLEQIGQGRLGPLDARARHSLAAQIGPDEKLWVLDDL